MLCVSMLCVSMLCVSFLFAYHCLRIDVAIAVCIVVAYRFVLAYQFVLAYRFFAGTYRCIVVVAVDVAIVSHQNKLFASSSIVSV